MARGRGLLLAGLAAGAYAYFQKPENRTKATAAFNNAKAKVNSYMESQNLETAKEGSQPEASTPKNTQTGNTASKEAPPSVQYYNEQEDVGKKVQLSSNDTSEKKEENTDNASPLTRLNTDNI